MPLETDCRKAVSGSPDGNILIVAGEASGDFYGAGLVREIRCILPHIRFYGIGGKKMKDAGVHLIAQSSEMAVVGLTEVAAKLRFILGVFFKLKKSLRNEKPDLVILIDYPDFNLPLARAAKKNGIKVFYYISPQVWAWRKGRIQSIRKCVNRMAVIFPFEESLYRKAGVPATFIGHPLLDVAKTTWSREEALRNINLERQATTIALLPGSRKGEVTKLLPVMLKAAEILAEEFPGIQFILPLADTLDPKLIEGIVALYRPKVRIIKDSIYDVLAASDAAIVTSGTATIDTALMETPMVVIYKVSGFTYLVGRLLIDVENIAMANIIAGKTIVRELIQGDATPKAIAKEVAEILKDDVKREAMIQELRKVRERLGAPGAAKRAAKLACELLEKAEIEKMNHEPI
jgi:lipid-A-disaccharide synthase